MSSQKLWSVRITIDNSEVDMSINTHVRAPNSKSALDTVLKYFDSHMLEIEDYNFEVVKGE